jgi:phosphatidylglycerol:prolipoprotein diacylglycerol transferase
MVDSHLHPEFWGIRPILFNIGNFGVPAYSFFVLLGLLVGILVYYLEAKRQKKLSENGFLIVFGALAGGIIGSKILQWLVDYPYFSNYFSNINFLVSGRTIIGGLIGGMVGSKITKKKLNIKEKRGNLFAPSIAIGVAIGRLGCFFRGCCFGKPTNLPWGVDFGDKILRHPTQIYESIFMLIMFIYLEKIKRNKNVKPGQLFKKLMVAYFIFRFFVEFLRVNLVVFAGLTIFQIISIIAIIFLVRGDLVSLFFKQKDGNRQRE